MTTTEEPGVELDVVRTPTPQTIAPPDSGEWNLIVMQANALAESSIVPKAFQGKPHDLIACTLMSRELGRGLMWGLRHLWISPDGKVAMSAEGMVSLVKEAGHDIWPIEVNREHAVAGWRRGETNGTVEYGIEEAIYAGLISRNSEGELVSTTSSGKPSAWQKFLTDMMWARVASRTCRRVFPDVLGGASYVPEELGARVNPETGEVDTQGVVTITVEQARTLRARASDLSDDGKDKLRAGLQEMGAVLYRGRDTEAAPLQPVLPASWLDRVETLLEQIEAEQATPPPDQPASGDDDAVEGEVVGQDDDQHDAPAAEDADVVADTAPGSEGTPVSNEAPSGPEGPFGGDTGHCAGCGGPIWFAAAETDGGPAWLHADAEDAAIPIHGPIILPAGPDVDIDQLYTAARIPIPPDQLRGRVEAAVGAMSPAKVILELGAAGLVANGPPATCAARLVEHRVKLLAGSK